MSSVFPEVEETRKPKSESIGGNKDFDLKMTKIDLYYHAVRLKHF